MILYFAATKKMLSNKGEDELSNYILSDNTIYGSFLASSLDKALYQINKNIYSNDIDENCKDDEFLICRCEILNNDNAVAAMQSALIDNAINSIPVKITTIHYFKKSSLDFNLKISKTISFIKEILNLEINETRKDILNNAIESLRRCYVNK